MGTENLGLGRNPGLVFFPFPAPLLLAGVTGPVPGPLEVQMTKLRGWGVEEGGEGGCNPGSGSGQIASKQL